MNSIIYAELQNWSEPIHVRFLHCYIVLKFLIIIQKIAANTCYSRSYELLLEALSCTYKISSGVLTRNITFWVPAVDLNKYILEYKWWTKLKNYVCYVHTYIYFIFLYIQFIPFGGKGQLTNERKGGSGRIYICLTGTGWQQGQFARMAANELIKSQRWHQQLS